MTIPVYPGEGARIHAFQQGIVPCTGNSLRIASDRAPDGTIDLALRIDTLRGSICYLIKGEVLLEAVTAVCDIAGAAQPQEPTAGAPVDLTETTEVRPPEPTAGAYDLEEDPDEQGSAAPDPGAKDDLEISTELEEGATQET